MKLCSHVFDRLRQCLVDREAYTSRSGTSFELNDLEALMNVDFEAKEWISAHTLKR